MINRLEYTACDLLPVGNSRYYDTPLIYATRGNSLRDTPSLCHVVDVAVVEKMLRVFSSLLRPTPLVCNKESLIARPVQNNCWNAQRWRVLIRGLRASATNRGLEEFFPRTDNPVEEGERSGEEVTVSVCVLI